MIHTVVLVEEFQKEGQNLHVDGGAGERGVRVEGKQVEEALDELFFDGRGNDGAACLRGNGDTYGRRGPDG